MQVNTELLQNDCVRNKDDVSLELSNPIESDMSGLRIIISLTFSQKDLGLDPLYRQLIEMKTSTERVQHVKRTLFRSNAGKQYLPGKTPSRFTASLPSVRMQFPVNRHDLALEWLYVELSAMSSSAERNLHVRRLLYFYCSGERHEVAPGAVRMVKVASIAMTEEPAIHPAHALNIGLADKPDPIFDAASDEKSKKRRKAFASLSAGNT